MSRQAIICGNWKMYKTIEESKSFVKSLAPLIEPSQALVYLAVPFTAIKAAADEAQETPIVIGAQNMNDISEGAFTGEIAARMLKDAGAAFVILGHSERRQIFGETDEFIRRKVTKAFQEGLEPIVCIGENLKEREAGHAHDVLQKQLEGSLPTLTASQIQSLVIAYEPVWAIGTGKVATAEIAQTTHQFCREWIKSKYGPEAASAVRILYGGSVKPDNITELMQQPDIDGALVGGASLQPDVFSQIIHY
jgi:triosephosphate isomerase